MTTNYALAHRPLIHMSPEGRTVLHNGEVTRIVMGRKKISIGCTDITPEAMRYLVKQYNARFPDPDEDIPVVLQTGDKGTPGCSPKPV